MSTPHPGHDLPPPVVDRRVARHVVIARALVGEPRRIRPLALPHGLHLGLVKGEEVDLAADALALLRVEETAAAAVEDVDAARPQGLLGLAHAPLEQLVEEVALHALLQLGHLAPRQLGGDHLRLHLQVRGELVLEAVEGLPVEDPAAASEARQGQGDEAEDQPPAQRSLAPARLLGAASHNPILDGNSGRPRRPGRRRKRAPAPGPSASRSPPPAVVT